MKINLEILDAAYIHDPQEIEALNTKILVPKMMTRRRLTRAAKIAVYLAHEVSFTQGRIVYGSSYGELLATAKILDAIQEQNPISPTHFQNSVYNTAISYLSMLQENQEEIMTISSGDKTSEKILKAGAVKALDQDTLLLMLTETLNIPNIEEVNPCQTALESGVALKVKLSTEPANIEINPSLIDISLPKSIQQLHAIAKSFDPKQKNIIEVTL